MTRHLSAQAVAQLLGIKTATLARWRRDGRGPRGFFHISTTLVLYPIEEVERFLAERKTTSSFR
jgi:predicted DNA-binding transcriptional regulator AlpA